jgi:hypothetical protein
MSRDRPARDRVQVIASIATLRVAVAMTPRVTIHAAVASPEVAMAIQAGPGTCIADLAAPSQSTKPSWQAQAQRT